MKFLPLLLATLVANPVWSSSPADTDNNVLYLHLMDRGEVVHTVSFRDPAFLRSPAQTIVVVRGSTLKTSLVMDKRPYRLLVHLPAGLCAAQHMFMVSPGGQRPTFHGVSATLDALDACPGDRRELLHVKATAQD